jgi:hypothetical protein
MTDLFAGGDDLAPLQEDENKNYFEELVGEGKKFKTPEELARGKAESDRFIARLLEEKKQLAEDLNARMRLEEVLDRMTNPGNNQPVRTPVQPDPDNDGQDKRTVDPVAIAKQVREELIREQQDAVRLQNIQDVKAKLAETWGPGFAQKLDETAKSLGMTREQINQVAMDTPKAFFKLVGADAPKAQTDLFTPPSSSVNAPFQPGTSERNYAYYQKLRKTDPTAYHSPSVQMQEYKDALRLGEKFYS